MGRKNRSKKIEDPGNAKDFKVNPFADLAGALPKEELPAAAEKPPPSPEPEPKVPVDPELAEAFKAGGEVAFGADVTIARLRFSLERKGRRGKTVTMIGGLEHLSMVEQMKLLQKIKRSLGVGGQFDEGILELQGDQRERAKAWFEKRKKA